AQDALTMGDARTATKIFAQIVAEDPTNPKGIAGLVRAYVASGSVGKARKLVSDLTSDLAANAEVKAAITAVDIAEQSGKVGNVRKLQAGVTANPDDHATRLDLSLALYAEGRAEEAMDHLLEIIRRDREWNEEAARKQLVKLFDALGGTNPLTIAYRRRLSSLLFS
ncbi:MAG: tetratricopeptide repeat protein, partial [Rhodospirillales bacterium]|nr:tetratricopeptide repeat protein [Rhodospirillales bacterium]